MKKLADMTLLAGQREEITVMAFRKSPGDVLAQVQMGKTFVITKNGKAVAVVSKPEPDAFQLGAAVRRLERRVGAPGAEAGDGA